MRSRATHIPESRSPRRPYCVVLVALLITYSAVPLAASDALRFVPANVAGVVTFPNLDTTKRHLATLHAALGPGYTGLDFNEIEATAGFNVGTLDTTRPIHIILFDPEDLPPLLSGGGLGGSNRDYPVIAFSPKDMDAFTSEFGVRENVAKPIVGAYGRFYLLVRDGVAFAAQRRKPLYLMRRVTPESSLASKLKSEATDSGSPVDIRIHLQLERWRGRIKATAALTMAFLKMQIASDESPERRAQVSAIVGWFVDGVLNALDQMESLDLTLSIDKTTLRIGHNHTFREGGSIAKYLESVERPNANLFVSLPDQPFFLAGAFNWKTPAESSFKCRFNRFFYNLDVVKQTIAEPMRQKLLQYSEKCAADMYGSQFMITSPEKQLHPLLAFSGYRVGNGEAFFKRYQYIQEHSADVMASFMPGGMGGGVSSYEKRSRDGIEFMQMKMDAPSLNDAAAREMTLFYGDQACVEQALLDSNTIMFTMSQDDGAIARLIKTLRSGATLDRNQAVRRLRSRLPSDAHGVVVFDVQRLMGVLPLMKHVARNSDSPPPILPLSKLGIDPVRNGALLGWSCRVQGRRIDCQWAIDTDDIRRLKMQSRQPDD